MLSRRHFLRNSAMLGAGAALTTMPAFRALADETMRLYWWGTPNRAERTLGVAKLFEAAHAGLKINGEVGGNDYWPKLTTMIAGGNAPDIFQLEPSRFADYTRRGTTVPLNDYLGKTIRTDKLAPGVVDLGTVDGKVGGMPMSLNAFAMFYDAEAFKAAGIAPPNEKTTWDDFAKMAVELTKAIGKKNVWGATNGARYNYAMQAFLEQRGKKLYSAEGGIGFDAKDAADWYGYWDSLAKAGGCVPAEIQALDKLNVDSNPMATGNCAMTIGFSNQLAGYQAVVKSRWPSPPCRWRVPMGLPACSIGPVSIGRLRQRRRTRNWRPSSSTSSSMTSKPARCLASSAACLLMSTSRRQSFP
jgi:multiple sugar transport system substrate-binding protein